MINSLIEMLELPNFGHMTTYNLNQDYNLIESYDNPRVAIFADIMKIVTMSIKKIFEDLKKT